MVQETKTPPPRPPKYERSEEFVDGYANNVRFESSVFDLKLVFGQSEQSPDGEVIMQHTAITIPWPVAKLMLFYLRLNIAFQEFQNGKVVIPPNQYPPVPGPEFAGDDMAQAKRIVEEMRGQFLRDEGQQMIEGEQ